MKDTILFLLGARGLIELIALFRTLCSILHLTVFMLFYLSRMLLLPLFSFLNIFLVDQVKKLLTFFSCVFPNNAVAINSLIVHVANIY